MRQLRRVILRTLFIIAMLAAGLTSVVTAAEAAVPDRWGFAVVDTISGIPNAAHQAGSWPAGFNVTVTPGAAGEVFVRFPQIGIPAPRTDIGVVHVTAISQAAQWCQVEKWGTVGSDEVVAVRCYLYGGTPKFTPFSIVFSSSSGLLPTSQAFGYVFWNGSGVASTYNSALEANSVTPTGTGVWTVLLKGLGSSGLAGGFQVTAVDSGVAARCKVSAWSPSIDAQKLQVRCFDKTDIPLNTGWNLTYQRELAITGAAFPPKNFAYTYDNMPSDPGPYVPAPPAVNYNSQGSFNEIQTAGTGRRLVTFHKVGVLQDDVQVTAFGRGPEFCNLVTLWGTYSDEVTVRNVDCYKAETPVDYSSMVSYVSAS